MATINYFGAVVVAQLVEWSLPTPEICSSNPAISNFIHYQLCYKDKNKAKKRQVMAHVFKNNYLLERQRYFLISGHSYKHLKLVNYDSRVVPDLKIPHITTLES